jgi:hypothetical protein
MRGRTQERGPTPGKYSRDHPHGRFIEFVEDETSSRMFSI